jgi:acetyl esterase/lipase
MKMNFRLALSMTLALGLTAMAAEGPPAIVLDLFPAAAPGDTAPIGEEQVKKKAGTELITSVTNVSKPTLTISKPAADKNTGVAVLVFPGGGYTNLAWEHEGTMVSEWLNAIGVTSVIVKYRVPRRPDTPKGQPPVGVLGFSAGGHLAAWCSTNSDKRAYETIDATEQTSCRPDFTVLIYPGGITKGGNDQLAPEIHVSKESQPTFLAVAGDDNGPAYGSAAYYLALKRAGVPAELHVYASGGHGFGMRTGNRPANTWPTRCEEWMREQGILKP